MPLYEYIEGGLYENIRSSRDNVYVSERRGDCRSVQIYHGKYYMTYVSGELAGRLKIIEISEADYKEALTGEYSQDQLTSKFKVY